MRLCMCIMRSKCWGGVFDEPINPVEPPVEKPETPVEPPVEKPEEPTTPPSTKDLLTIKIDENIMAVVGTNEWSSIAYGNGKYVAVGYGGYITTSTDGINWTTPKQIISSNLRVIAFGNGIFVTAGGKNIACSSDGNNWIISNPPLPFVNSLFSRVAYNNGIFVVSTADEYCWNSTDGKTWSEKIDTGISNIIWDIVPAENQFMAFASKQISVSENGTEWTLLPDAPPTVSQQIAYGNGIIVMVSGQNVFRSTDKKTWTLYRLPNDNYRLFQSTCISFINNMFVIVGYLQGSSSTPEQYCAVTSVDGETFSDYIPLNDENGQSLSQTPNAIIKMQ